MCQRASVCMESRERERDMCVIANQPRTHHVYSGGVQTRLRARLRARNRAYGHGERTTAGTRIYHEDARICVCPHILITDMRMDWRERERERRMPLGYNVGRVVLLWVLHWVKLIINVTIETFHFFQ